MNLAYGSGIREAFHYLMSRYREVFTIGQGLWSPWYVGNSMTDLDVEFGKSRVIDTPVAEMACTGVAIGASLCGYRPVVIHPRVDFLLMGMDQVVNQAAKWTHMFGGQSSAPVTIRAIVNRGGEQGAQHSQSLHSWFAHIPGLRVVVPYSPLDARDLLVASVLCDDPVVYIDDRWLYDLEESHVPVRSGISLREERPLVRRAGRDMTLAGCGYSVHLCMEAAAALSGQGIECEVVDLRVVYPLDIVPVLESVERTGRLLVVDGDWSSCGLAAEVIARVVENGDVFKTMKSAPSRLTMAEAPAPTSRVLERIYYTSVQDVMARVRAICKSAQ